MSALDQPQVEVSLEQFLKRVRPRLKTLFARYRIPPQDTEDILQQALLALVYQRQTIRDPEAWLVGTLRNKCLLYWREHRRKLYDAVDAAVLECMAEPMPPAQEGIDLRRDLPTPSSACRNAAGRCFRCGTVRGMSRRSWPSDWGTVRPASARSRRGASPR